MAPAPLASLSVEQTAKGTGQREQMETARSQLVRGAPFRKVLIPGLNPNSARA
jgi:hypothetical protein